ncbi:hypothetical protein TWF281_007865 [Arthrobotrys megalospora]
MNYTIRQMLSGIFKVVAQLFANARNPEDDEATAGRNRSVSSIYRLKSYERRYHRSRGSIDVEFNDPIPQKPKAIYHRSWFRRGIYDGAGEMDDEYFECCGPRDTDRASTILSIQSSTFTHHSQGDTTVGSSQRLKKGTSFDSGTSVKSTCLSIDHDAQFESRLWWNGDIGLQIDQGNISNRHYIPTIYVRGSDALNALPLWV